ncbi:uncharacterized protein LOC128920325 [Zeugodacus cucurbitae]|uniref:uncharacterized protein LOC128920325 n=1 Tax=Zeugodacus cucurbitae TaxID=28588 RepID=UPI0023D8EC0D|nr:uncharacterized protein LOC128920325 [Zeugodacus cucurbitae]
MRVLQLNLNHCEAAQELLSQTVYEQKIDVAIISEQYRNKSESTWISDCTNKAAIWACGGKAFQDKPLVDKPFYARAKIGGINFYSCYIPPSVSQSDFEKILDELVKEVLTTTMNVVAGDFNAWATEWGSIYTNRRGDALLKAFSVLDTVLLNTGNQNTFEKNGRGSVIDITFASRSLVRTTSWQVCDLYTHSDHQAIIKEIGHLMQNRRSVLTNSVQTRGWKIKTLDDELFRLSLEDNLNYVEDIDRQAEMLVKHISKACNASMCRKKFGACRKPVYWWNAEIDTLRRDCHKARRIYQRSRGATEQTELRERFKSKRNDLKKAIKKSKTYCFKELCGKIDENPWGDAYKIVMSRIKGGKSEAPTCPILLKTVVETLFPSQPVENRQARGEDPPEKTYQQSLT